MDETNYVLITLAHNEEENLPSLAGCILGQTLGPKAWVIIDDSSTDRTSQIIDEFIAKNSWIYTKKIGGYSENLSLKEFDLRWSKIVKDAFDFAEDICRKANVQYKYIGRIDADIILPLDYCERLIKEFLGNPKLGYVGGRIVDAKLDNNGAMVKTREGFMITDNRPIDGCSLIRVHCLHQIGGISITHDVGGILATKVLIGGWQTKVFKDIKAFHTRKRGITGGAWHGYAQRGFYAYYLGITPTWVLIHFFSRILRLDFRFAFGYLYGYLSSLLKGEEKIEDEEIKAYYRHQRSREIWKAIRIKIRSTLHNFNWRRFYG